jgi:phospholipase/lecithinase/hemolysin
MSPARTLFGWLLFASLAAASPHQPYQRLYVFGDSYSDIGAGYLDGDGPTAVAYLAEHLGLQLLPANTPHPAGASLDFAVSGARTGEGAGSKVAGAWLGYGMQNQVNDFAALVRSRKIRFKPKKTLFFIAGGLNDGKLATETTVANLENEIRTLYSLGARHFALALLPTAIPDFSAVGQRLNPALTLIPPQLAHEWPKAQISLSHWGPFFDEVLNNPTPYGIRNTTDACAGRAIFHQDATPCSSPADHFYYHAGHPSTAVHKIVGEKLYRELFTGPPPPDAGRALATHR